MPLTTSPSPRIVLPTPLERRWQAVRVLQGRLEEALEKALQTEHGLSVSEYAALAALAYSDDGGHLRMQVLADAIPLRQSSVSRLVGRLERAGLTERYLCSTDRRGVYTQIGDRGRVVLEQARQTHRRVFDQVLAATDDDAADAEEIAEAIEFLRAAGQDAPARDGGGAGF